MSSPNTIAKTRWTRYERQIWEEFDHYMDGYMCGNCEEKVFKYAIGREADGSPILYFRAIMEADGGATVQMTTGYANYPQTPPARKDLTIPDEITAYEDLFPDDGVYNIFKHELPPLVLDAAYNIVDLHAGNGTLAEFVAKEAGTVDEIKDRKLRAAVRESMTP